jgi:hypothetical protein
MPQTGALLPITLISTNQSAKKAVSSVSSGFAISGRLDDEECDPGNQQHGGPPTRQQ